MSQKEEAMSFKFYGSVVAELETVIQSEVDSAKASLRHPDDGEPIGEWLGEMSPELQKVWALINRYYNDLFDELEREAQYSAMLGGFADGAEMESVIAPSVALKVRIGGIEGFFWSELRMQFGVNTSAFLAVREGWRVYYLHPRCEDCGALHSREGEEAMKQLNSLKRLRAAYEAAIAEAKAEAEADTTDLPVE